MKGRVMGAALIAVAVSVSLLAAPGKQHSSREASELAAAVKAGKADRVASLVRDGANPNVRDSIGMTPLHYAAYRGAMAVGFALLEGGADPNAKDSAGMTPLHAASFEGHADFVNALLKAGASVNAKDHAGNTALHYAVFNGDVPTSKVLLAGGARASIANGRGATPAAMARASGQPALVRLFETRARKKAPRVITNDTLAHMQSDGHFVVQEGGGGTSGKAGASKGHGRSRRSGKTVAERVNADYARIDRLLMEKRTLSDEIPQTEKACDDFKRLQRGEQVDSSVGSGPPDPNTSSSYGAYKRKLARYQERLKKRLEATCGKLHKIKSRMAAIDAKIARLREEILQLDAQ